MIVLRPLLQMLFLACWSGPWMAKLCADEADKDTRLIEDLLALAVPAPDWKEQLCGWMKAGWTPPPLEYRAPGDDAPIEKLVEFWRSTGLDDSGIAPPGPKVRDRLLEYGMTAPGSFAELARWFEADRPGVAERIRLLHETMPFTTEEQRKHKVEVHDWLMTHAGDFPQELAERARDELRKGVDDWVMGPLFWFMRRDWTAARALLMETAKEGEAGTQCLALRLLYKHNEADGADPPALRETWRTALCRIVERAPDGVTKAKALEALGSPDWPGRADWILTLFKDPALAEVSEGYQQYEPLCSIVRAAPDFWIPRIVPFVSSANRTEHNNAVRCLVQFHITDARADALRPLLPWLSDPSWASTDEYGRLRLIQSLDRLAIPESIPGLIWSVEHDDGYALSGAADALVHYKAREAVPALKGAFSREKDPHHRRDLARALVALEGFSVIEMAGAIVTHVEQSLTPNGKRAIEQSFDVFVPGDRSRKQLPLSDAVTLGMTLAGSRRLPDAVSQVVRRRAQELRPDRPDVAVELERLIVASATPEAVSVIRDALRSGAADAYLLDIALADPDLLRAALKEGGEWGLAGRMLQALVSGDASSREAILRGHDTRASAMLCAIARAGRVALPVPAVARLLDSTDAQCARAAELFLEAEDGPEARKGILQHHPGTARILGMRHRHDPGHISFGEFDTSEEELRQRVLAADGPDEIYAVLSAGYWGGAGQVFVLVKSGNATLLQDQGGGRQRSRRLTREELAEWKNFASKNRVDDLAPLNQEIHDGIQYEFVHLTRDGGRRVFMNNPPRGMHVPIVGMVIAGGRAEGPDAGVYGSLVDTLSRFVESGPPMQVDYRFSVPVPGLELVMPAEVAKIEAIMMHQSQLVVLAQKPGESRPAWRRLAGRKPGAEVTDAMPVILTDSNQDSTDGFHRDDWLVNAPWRASLGAALVQPATRESDGRNGLWSFEPGRAPRLLAEGTFAKPLTTPDARWIIAAKTLGHSWAELNTVVRLDPKTGHATPLSLEPAETFDVVAWVKPLGRVLIYRESDASSPFDDKKPEEKLSEHRLLDPDTGDTRVVTGEFTPLHHESWRPLQPTSSDGIVWAAIPYRDGRKVITQVGRYDLRTFSFEPWLAVSGLEFSSMTQWVEEQKKLIYVTVNGDLLSLPLPGKPAAAIDRRNHRAP